VESVEREDWKGAVERERTHLNEAHKFIDAVTGQPSGNMLEVSGV
jgi:hypothetical protein